MDKGRQSSQLLASDENVLINHDYEIFETVLSQFDPYQLIMLPYDIFMDLQD
jgi:hypothetical protein